MIAAGAIVAVVALLAVGLWRSRRDPELPAPPDPADIGALRRSMPLGEFADPLPIEHEDREHQVE